jgi:hypothetical protein
MGVEIQSYVKERSVFEDKVKSSSGENIMLFAQRMDYESAESVDSQGFELLVLINQLLRNTVSDLLVSRQLILIH